MLVFGRSNVGFCRAEALRRAVGINPVEHGPITLIRKIW